MSRRLENKTILVVGGGGIGDECARRYCEDGANVLLGDLDGAAAAGAANKIDPSGKRALGTVLNGADEQSVADAVSLAVSTFGRLDGMHANFANFADGRSVGGALDIPLEIFDEMMTVNVRGFLLCTRYTVPEMIKGGGGSIVYTSSGAAYAGEAVRPYYAMSKSAIHALMRHVARRYGPQGIRANVIAPGIIMHPKLAAAVGEAFQAQAIERTLCRSRLGTPNDIARLASLLLSEDGGFITGQVISVDGGVTMRA
jgi:NAD(P)-dependent dehydrogenase (short-subunit alcohol dehydrogenase family)